MFRSKWESLFVLFLLMLFLTGLFLALYPYLQGAVVDRWMNQETEAFLNRADSPKGGEDDIAILPTMPEPRNYPELWNAIEDYNQQIFEEEQSQLTQSGAYQDSLFNLTDYGLPDETFGVITIPKLDLEMPLYLGATDENMAKGAAVLSETSIPIGGENTNAVIAGHRGWGGASYFRYVPELVPGDEVLITNLWEALRYQVVGTKIIDPNEIEHILIQPGRDMVTLLTCHPYASGGKQRYLVYCERILESQTKEVSYD